MRQSDFQREARGPAVTRIRPAGRRALLTTTALIASGLAMALLARPASAQQVSVYGTEIVDGGGLGVGTPPSTKPAEWNVGSDWLYVGLNEEEGELIIRNGGRVLGSYTTIAAGSGAVGEVVVTGTGSALTIVSGRLLHIGDGGVGRLAITDGGEVTSGRLLVGLNNGVGEIAVTGTGSRLATSGQFLLGGDGGTAALTVADGATVANSGADLGGSLLSTGRAVVTGEGSTWSAAYFNAGRQGSGSLTLATGGALNTSLLTIAAEDGSTGVVNIGAAAGDAAAAPGSLSATTIDFGTGAGSMVFNHTGEDFALDADINGAGTLRLLAGRTTLSGDNTYTGATLLEGGALVLGSDTALGGSTLTTRGSVVSYADGVTIANPVVIDSNTTQFEVLTGSATQAGVISELNGPRPFEKIGGGELVLTAENTWTGATTVRDGTLTFDGGELVSGGSTRVGALEGETAALVIRNGGAVLSEEGVIGAEAGASGQATVTGQDSRWDNGSNMSVGSYGDGTLTIADGGVVSNSAALIGDFAGATGAVTVTGQGSTWTNRSIFVGLSGTGYLTVADGGTVTGRRGYIGDAEDAFGQAIVTGTDSVWALEDALYVGMYGEGRLTIETGGQVTNTSAILGDDAGATGAVTVTGANSSWVNDDDVVVGGDGNGTLIVAAGAAVSSGEGLLARAGGSYGTATVTGAGSTWNNSGRLTVGDRGTGVLTIADAASMSNAEAFIGNDVDSVGRVIVDGADTVWTNNAPLYVGFEGDGGLTIQAGGEVSSGESFIGVEAGSIGSVSATGAGSLWASNSDIYIGSAGTGRLSIADGATVSNTNGDIGRFAGSTGTVTVTGAGSLWDNTLGVHVGRAGDGALSIADGGVVSAREGWIGSGAGSTGVVSVTGPGSTWANTAAILVGGEGNGSMTLSNGGVASSAGSLMGVFAGSTAAATVTGAGSAWVNTGYVIVGSGGAANLTIADGGRVSGTDAYVAVDTGASGAVTVTGAGSLWSSTGFVGVGWGDDGSVTLSNGGVAAANEVILGVNAGGSGVLNIGGAAGDAAAIAGTLDSASLAFGLGAGELVFNHTSVAPGAGYTFGSALSSNAAGNALIRNLAGTTRLTGASTGYQGGLSVEGGVLSVDGMLGSGAVTATVAGGGTLTGTGVLDGDLTVQSGGILAGNSGLTFTIGGDVVLQDGAVVNAALGVPGGSALFAVGGDLTLDGVLNVTDAGGFGAGLYRLFDYGGTLTDNGLAVGALPSGAVAGDVLVETATPGRVNLINTTGVELRFWDGAGPADDGLIQGGAGSWGLGGRSWTGTDGGANGAYDNPAFAVFTGAGGAVTVRGGGIGVTGMQFAVDGYRITGDGLALASGRTLIRVGDGSLSGAATTATIGSSLTGTGGLVKTDLGTLILTGANSYTGGTFVEAGTLVGNTASIAGDVDNDATLVFDQATDASFTGAISGDGLTVKRGVGLLSLTGVNQADWSVQSGSLLAQAGRFTGDVGIASGASFTLNASTDSVFSGVLSGNGTFTKAGGGDLVLTGNSAAFAGATEIRQGLLLLNGSLGGELRIAEGGMLGGSGALARLTAGDGAVISPGNSIGTLNITGDVRFEAGSVYDVEVDPATDASDRIVAGGIATLAGGTVRHIGLTGAYRPSSTYTILTAAGGVTGTFAAIETDFAFLDASLAYQTNAVLMTLERNAIPFPAVGETRNQRAVASAVEAIGTGTPLYDAVVGLDAGNARRAFEAVSGELHGSIRTAQSEAAQALAGTLSRRMAARAAQDGETAFWAGATGSRARLVSDGNAASLTRKTGGLMIGTDTGVGAARLGLAAGASTHDYDSPSRSGKAEGESYSLAVYGSSQWRALALSGAVSGTWHTVESERRVTFPGFAERLDGDYDARTVHAFVEAAWRVETGAGTTLAPFLNLARVRTETDAFTETGGDAALSVQGRVQAATLATAGIGFARVHDQRQGRNATLSARLGWRHAWGDTTSDGRHAFAGDPAFTVRGLPLAEDAVVAELGLEVALKDRLSLTVDWSGQQGADLQAHGLAASLSWRF